MEDRRFIKPKEGLTVRDPETNRRLPEHGKGIAWNSFWQRRLDDSDVEYTTEEAVLAGDQAVEDGAREIEAAIEKTEKKARGGAPKGEETSK
ncbi:MAG: DUF2635 domain-containing protein [Sphingomonas sp.]